MDEETLSLERYLQIIMRRKWLLLSTALTVLVLSALNVFTATPIYRASATLQIDPENQNILPYEEIEAGGSQMSQEDYLWTQAEKLRSRGLARRVIDKLSLADFPAFTERHRKGLLLDLVGDMALANCDIHAHIQAHRSGHRLNARLVQTLLTHYQAAGTLMSRSA